MGDAFGVKAYDYLLKPVSQPVFEGELRRAIEELKRLDAQLVCETRYEDAQNEQYIVIQAGRDTLNLKYRDVIYIESNGRKSIIHSEGNAYDVYFKNY